MRSSYAVAALARMVEMEPNAAPHRPAHQSDAVSLRDVILVTLAVLAIIFANVEVVQALDIALDVLHR